MLCGSGTRLGYRELMFESCECPCDSVCAARESLAGQALTQARRCNSSVYLTEVPGVGSTCCLQDFQKCVMLRPVCADQEHSISLRTTGVLSTFPMVRGGGNCLEMPSRGKDGVRKWH